MKRGEIAPHAVVLPVNLNLDFRRLIHGGAVLGGVFGFTFYGYAVVFKSNHF
jgi:hypothetical protein